MSMFKPPAVALLAFPALSVAYPVTDWFAPFVATV